MAHAAVQVTVVEITARLEEADSPIQLDFNLVSLDHDAWHENYGKGS
jgi:hypothetical protein